MSDVAIALQTHYREKLAQWMMSKGFSTGHGDSVDDLLRELSWQIDEIKARETALEREIDGLQTHVIELKREAANV